MNERKLSRLMGFNGMVSVYSMHSMLLLSKQTRKPSVKMDALAKVPDERLRYIDYLPSHIQLELVE